MSKDKSKDLTASEAVNIIKAMDKAGDIKKYVKGDGRKTVADAAEARIDAIKAKKEAKKSPKAEAKAEAKAEPKKTPSR